MQKKQLRQDDTIYFSRQLEYIKAKIQEVRYPNFKQRSLIPVSFEADPGAKTITYRQYDSLGIAKIIANYAKDFPRASVKGEEFTAKVKSLGASYGYSVQDIRSARMAGINLEQREANAARKCIMQKEQAVAYFGDSAYGLGGFLTNANIPTGSVPADGTGSATTFASKTADQIIRDLHACANDIVENTNEVEEPDTLLLPVAQFTYIASTPRSSTSDTTILDFFLKSNPYINSVVPLNQLKEPDDGWSSVGASFTGDIMVAYRRNPDVLTLEIPQDFEVFPEQLEGLEYKVPVHQRIGGTIIYLPLAINICEGI